MIDPTTKVGAPMTETPELRRRYRRLCLSLAALAGLLLLVLGTMNTIVDPFGVFRWVAIHAFEGRREGIGTRTGKAEVFRHRAHHTVILGSSRAEVGMDPAFAAWGFPADAPRGVNLGLAGTNMVELGHAYDFVARDPSVRRVVLCLDFLMFGEGRTHGQDFIRSRFNPATERPNYYMSNLFSRFAAEQSIDTVRLAARRRMSRYTDLGFRAGHDPLANRGSHRRLIRAAIRNALRNPEVYKGFVYSKERVETVGRIVADARSKDIEVLIVIPPVHALELETVRIAGLWGTLEEWKRDLVRQVEANSGGDLKVAVWDFTDYSEYAIEPVPPDDAEGRSVSRMRWFWESSHFTRELGELVAERIADRDAPPGFGVRLDSRNIETHLNGIASRRESFLASQPEAVSFVESIAAEAGIRPAE